jgi:hypothetical protein
MNKHLVRILAASSLVSSFFSETAFSQPFQIGHVTLQLTDTSRNNRSIPAEVYYPALTAGEEVPVASGQFPVLSFGHGFVMIVSAYTNFSNLLVPEGYIFILPNTETGISPSHNDFALDLSYVIRAMSMANTDPGSLFFGSIAGSSAVMGHSMGGGASMLAAGSDTSITAVVNFAAANTNPSAIAASSNITRPALLFAGAEDCVTPPSQHQEIMYDSLASSCKTLISVTGGGHCYFANANFLCTFGENSCGPNLTISREEQQDVTFSFLIPWLDHFLKAGQGSWEIFSDSLVVSQRITYQQECELTRIRENGTGQIELKLFPVPFRDRITVDGDTDLSSVKVYDISGREVFSQMINSDLPAGFSLGFLDTGFYQFIFTGKNGMMTSQKGCKL